MSIHKFPYQWTLKDAAFTKDKGKVFSCFACGGGSTMGYKLAGFDVIGCNEIDPRMNKVYVINHHPQFNYLEGIQTFKKRKDLPAELYNLDILDGSPPCSSFSTSGNRSEDWGKEKKFREGQACQVLDTLFFDFIDLAKELQPKVVIAENVKGLLIGDAISYVRKIYEEFDKANYYCQHVLLNSKNMGVPQQRERVFFLCLRKDLAEPFLYQYDLFTVRPKIELSFNEEPIPIKEFTDYKGKEIKSPVVRTLWENRKFGDKDQSSANMRLYGKPSNFGQSYVYQDEVCWTLTSKDSSIIHFDEPRVLSVHEVNCVSTFPQDYDYNNESPHYIAGMSVPPIMMAQVASNVYTQWLSKIAKTKVESKKGKIHIETKNKEIEDKKETNKRIKGKVHCFFEQSGTFKREFIKLGIPAEDYDIQNNFGETDHLDDLFKAIEDAYDGKPSLFDNITKDDLIIAFFPCIYFCENNQLYFMGAHRNLEKLSKKEKADTILKRSQDRAYFYELALKMFTVCDIRGIRLIVENPYAGQHFLVGNFPYKATFVDRNRAARGDYFNKPTQYWFINCEPTHGQSFQKAKMHKKIASGKPGAHGGLCSEDRSLISPDYARNFICDFILGKEQKNTQLTLF